MKWERDGADWPNRAYSRFIDHRLHRWHVQRAGDGPKLLLLHGAGASTHTWRDVLPDLARDHEVFALDLPGQGFTRLGARSRCGLAPMADDIASLLEHEAFEPAAVIGHSAGAVIAAQLALTRPAPPKALVSINGAFGRFRGLAGVLFPIAAKLLSLNPFTAPVFARLAGNPRAIDKLLRSTGSRLDARGVDLYRRLISDSSHVDATLSMMAQWDLDDLLDRLPEISTPLLLMVGSRDGSVPPDTATEVAGVVKGAEIERFEGLGHLLHEERPELASERIRAFLEPCCAT